MVLLVVSSTVGTIVIVGVPYVESLEDRNNRQTMNMQLETVVEAFGDLIGSKPGEGYTHSIAPGMDGTVSINSDVTDKTIISYALDSNYNFSVISADESEIQLDVKEGTLSSADIFWFNFDRCFLAGTKVVMADGSYKNIEDIVVGDLVLAYDEGTGVIANCKVTHTFYHTPEEMTEYYLSVNGNLQVTPNHRFYSEGEWVYAGNLKVGDSLLTKELSESYAVSSLEKIYEKVPTYDLEIENLHTFFVSIDEGIDILVHNPVEGGDDGGIGGSPSNSPPYEPSSPNPADGAAVQDNTLVTLSWTGGDPDAGDTVTYDVLLFEYEGGPVVNPYPTIAYDISTTFHVFGYVSVGIHYYWNIVARDNNGHETIGPSWDFTVNTLPDTPVQPDGPQSGWVGTSYQYNTSTTDPDEDQVRYGWDWDDGNPIEWSDFYPSGTVINTQHAWTNQGTYNIKVKAKDSNGGESSYSAPYQVTITAPAQANDDYVTVNKNSQSNLINVLANDNGDGLQIREIGEPDHGTAWKDGNYIRYTPDLDYNGPDSFTYSIEDAYTNHDEAMVWVTINNKPNLPTNPSGQTDVEILQSKNYTTSTLDPDEDQVQYGWDWDGNGIVDEWTDFYASGAECETEHTWSTAGTYEVKVIACDEHEALSEWSGGLNVTVNGPVLAVSPTSIELELKVGATTFEPEYFVISNEGTMDLGGVEVIVDPRAEWCRVDPRGNIGDIPIGESISISVDIVDPSIFTERVAPLYCNIVINTELCGQKTVRVKLIVVDPHSGSSSSSKGVGIDNGNTIITPDRPFTGTVVIDLLDENDNHVGSIWLFESNSMTYEMFSSVGKTKFVIERGGVIDASSKTEYVETGPRIANNENIIHLPITQMVASPENTLSSGALSKLKTDLKGSATDRYDLRNSGAYGLRIQLSGDHTDAWVDFFEGHDFKQEPPQGNLIILLYEYDGVTLNLWHSYVEVALEL